MEIDKQSLFNKLGRIFSILFQLVLFLFLASLLLREIFPDFINSVIDISWFLLFIIIFGILTIVFPTRSMEGIERQIISREFVLMVLLGTLVGYLIFSMYGIALGTSFGIISVIIAIIIAVLTFIRKKKENSPAPETNTPE